MDDSNGMERLVRYLTHPQVEIDPTIPVPQWGLSAVGRRRVTALGARDWLSSTTEILSSGERKTLRRPRCWPRRSALLVEVRDAMHENNRCATGFLRPDEI